ncbi:MAG: hypothetical protein ABJD24_11255 [Acidimicrobiales bacterium]
MTPSDRDRAINDALAGRAPAGHPDLEPVAAFAAELRERATRAQVGPSPAVTSLLRGEKDLGTYVELETERTRRRPSAIWAAAAAVAVALGGVAVVAPWESGGTTPTAASATAPVETTGPTESAPATTVEPIVTTTVQSPPATAAAVTVPFATVETRPTTEPPSTTAKSRPPETPTTTVLAPPPPPAGLEQARARWRECATNGQQAGLTQEQIAARCGNEPNLEGYRSARTSWETCMKENLRSGPTAICGPEPDPAAYGFVPPVWPPQP